MSAKTHDVKRIRSVRSVRSVRSIHSRRNICRVHSKRSIRSIRSIRNIHSIQAENVVICDYVFIHILFLVYLLVCSLVYSSIHLCID